MLVKSALHRIQRRSARRHAFDCRDRGAVSHHRQHRARFCRLSVDLHGARAALRRVAADMRASQAKILADQVHEELARLDLDRALRPVNLKCDEVTLLGLTHVSSLEAVDSMYP